MERAPVREAAGRREAGTRSPRCTVSVYPDAATLSLAVAALVVSEARRSVKERGRFSFFLAGGSSPKEAYTLLARPPFVELIPWSSVHVLWGDERCVASSDPRSNERMARKAFLERVPVPREQVHPMNCAGGREATAAAAEYEEMLRGLFVGECRCDLVLLGLGPDGHTASLFPGSDALTEQRRWVVPVPPPEESGADASIAARDLARVTLTLPFINQARLVVFLVDGEDKAEVVGKVLQGVGGEELPARLVRPANGTLQWYLDDGAASLLCPRHSGEGDRHGRRA